jgi:predicted NUDIX family NTP pyrophosphohydrolase
MGKTSAGILLYRKKKQAIEVLLVHPGGPFWKNKDEGAWTIPKGEADADENLLATAIREFYEETGISLKGNFVELQPVKQKSGKLVYAWALEGEMDADNIKSNSFEIEWPVRSGRYQSFPEIDKASWFNIKKAEEKINPAQIGLLTQLAESLSQ